MPLLMDHVFDIYGNSSNNVSVVIIEEPEIGQHLMSGKSVSAMKVY